MRNLKTPLKKLEKLNFSLLLVLTLVLLLLSCIPRTSEVEISESAKPYFDKGVELFEKNDFQDALKNFAEALKKDSLNPIIHYWIGKTHIELGKPDRADLSFRKALGLNPSKNLREKIEREILQLSKSEPVIEEEREEEITPEEVE